MRGMLGAVIAVSLLLTGEAQAARLIAVLPLDVSHTKGKLDKAGQASIEEMLRDTATNALRPHGWTILSGENTIQVLIDNGVQPEECGNQSCHLANARELKAEAFISGTVQFVEGEYIASIRLIETKGGSLLTSERVRAKSVNALTEAFEARADDFFRKSGLLTSPSPANAPPLLDTSRPQVKKGQVTEVVGSLMVTAKPKDSVRLELVDPNGKTMASGAPYENKAAMPGRWKVIARASGYEEEQQSIEVPPDDVTVVKFDLKQLGALTVTGEPAGSAVKVTGPGGFTDEGGLPWEATGLKRGTYQVKVTRKGYVDASQTVEVTSGKTATVNVSLRKGGLGTKVEPKSGLEFVGLPGGTFHVGCEPGDTDCDEFNDRPKGDVTVGAFWMGKTEVTVEAYAKCVQAGACLPPEPGDRCNWGVKGRERHPINCVNWDRSAEFCSWIGGRLPTSEEWEYAAKGGKSRIYPWGNDPVTGQRGNFCDTTCLEEWKDSSRSDGYATTAPVGTFPQGNSEHGLQDMAGNVSEWAPDDRGLLLLRGGSARTNVTQLRASFRLIATRSSQYDMGFRCGIWGGVGSSDGRGSTAGRAAPPCVTCVSTSVSPARTLRGRCAIRYRVQAHASTAVRIPIRENGDLD